MVRASISSVLNEIKDAELNNKKTSEQESVTPIKELKPKAIRHKGIKPESIKVIKAQRHRATKAVSHKDIMPLRQQDNKTISPKGTKAITGRPEEWNKNNKIQVRWYLPIELKKEIEHYLIDHRINKQEFFTEIVDVGFKAIRQEGNKS